MPLHDSVRERPGTLGEDRGTPGAACRGPAVRRNRNYPAIGICQREARCHRCFVSTGRLALRACESLTIFFRASEPRSGILGPGVAHAKAGDSFRAPVLGSAATAAPTAPQQPRTADKVASTEAVANAPPTSPAQSAASEPRPNGCPPPPEDSSGPSTLTVSGPCAFEHKGIANCEWHADDFYLSMTRKAAQGATLTVYINVEGYDGPGQYKSAQMFIGVQVSGG